MYSKLRCVKEEIFVMGKDNLMSKVSRECGDIGE